MMFLAARFQRFLTSLSQTSQQVINYILNGVNKVFEPSKDDYPIVGVQPFDGNLTKK
ncbi:MAG: hypothetical protein SAK29_36610 [Scytonema sp. PMC 1069.18]|nr:hypothetical protein [Scytonema sp. PMC 1069.18]MEC4881488.1 hypothetical protein [Scytonema sp. PMC 1070.18]